MRKRTSLADELIGDRQIEEFRFAIRTDVRSMIDEPRVRRVAARVYTRLAEAWGLSDSMTANLILIRECDVRAWQSGDPAGLDADELEKISCLLGIYRNLATLYSGHMDRVDHWLLRDNRGPLFEGKAPFDLLSGASANVYHSVRREVAGATV